MDGSTLQLLSANPKEVDKSFLKQEGGRRGTTGVTVGPPWTTSRFGPARTTTTDVHSTSINSGRADVERSI